MKQLSLLLILLLLLCSSCVGQATGETDNSSAPISSSEKSSDLAGFLTAVDLPENLSLKFDPAEVEVTKKARNHTAKKMLFAVDKTKENLLRQEVISSQNYAEGPWFEAGDDSFREYLCLYHDAVQGGLTYSAIINGVNPTVKLYTVIVDVPGPDEAYGRLDSDLKKSNFSSETDLDFQPFAQAVSSLEQILQMTGFPDLEIMETYSLDLETMKSQHAIHLRELSRYTDEDNDAEIREKTNYEWTKDDECYLFFLRQQVDRIPLINQHWQGQGAASSPAGNPMPGSTVTAYWSKHGLISINANNLFSIVESGQTQELISPVQALQVLLDDFSAIIISRPIWIESVELCYVSIPAQENGYFSLVPAWVICLGEEATVLNGEEADSTYIKYRFEVINAIDGKKISR